MKNLTKESDFIKETDHYIVRFRPSRKNRLLKIKKRNHGEWLVINKKDYMIVSRHLTMTNALRDVEKFEEIRANLVRVISC